jgi:chromosome segregation ATPase
LGEHSAKIEYLYLALEGTEAAEKDSRAQSGELRVAVENLQSELEEISTRYETLKGEKQRVDAVLQSKSRALEALEQEKEDEVKRGVAREKRIRSVSAEINDLDERLGREISARHKAELETEEIAAKLVAANSELQYLRTKLNEVETLCSQLQETKLQMQLEVTDCTSKLKAAEEENHRLRSTAEVLREELEDEVKRNKELQSNLHRKSRALEEAYNDLSLLQHEKKTTDGVMSNLQAKLDSTNSSLMQLQAAHQATKEEHDRIAMRVSSVERVEADVRVKLDRETARAIHLEQQLYDEAEKVAGLMAKVDDFERTIMMVLKRVDDFRAGTERTTTQYRSQNAALHQKSADNVAANAKYKSELCCLDAELQQANQRSQSLELSLRQVLEDSAKFGEALQERTLRHQQNLENILEQLCVAIDPSAFVISSRPTPSLSFSRRKSEEFCSAGEKEDVKHADRDDFEQEEANAEWKVEGYVAGGDTSLIEALCVQEPKSWSEIGAAASEKAVQINDELRWLKAGKDQLNHCLQVREEEVEVLSVALEKVQRDLISSEAREKDHVRRADDLSKDLVALKEEQKSLKARLIESRDRNSELESVVDASCKDQLMLKMQWNEAKKELEDAKVRVEELEEQHRDDGKQKLRLQLEVDAKGSRLEQLEKDLTLCQMQLKDSNYEKDEALREVEHHKSDAFQAYSQLAEAKNALRIFAEEKMSQQKRHEVSIAHKNEMIEGLRQEMVAARQDIVAVREGQDKLRGEVNMLENERETLRTELADLKLQLTMTLERETVLKDKILENEERGAQILQAKKQRIEILLEEVQAAEHASVVAEAETDKTKLELKKHIDLLEEERGKTHDLRSAIEQAALREERLLAKSGHLKELHEDDAKALVQRDDQITKLEDQLFAVTKRMHEVHVKHENAEAEWKYRHENDTAQLAEKAKRLEHLTGINKKMYVAICGEDMPDFFQYTGISDNFFHHSELASNKALSHAAQMRTNFKNARTQVESIQRSILNQDDYKSDKIRQYEDQIWALTVQIKEIQEEKQENSMPDEFSTKRIEMLEEEVSIKSEQLASCQSRLEAAKQELSEKHEQNLEHVKRIEMLEEEISIKNAKVDTVLDKCLVGTDLVGQTLMHVQTALHYANGRAQATQQSLRQAAYEQLYKEGETISAMMNQVKTSMMDAG